MEYPTKKEGISMNIKKLVGEKAAEFVEDNMVVGLGTGSTAYYMVEAIGKRVQQGLNIIGVPTSKRTQLQAEKLGIPLKSVDEVAYIDITIDGADEISSTFQGIKGGGGALLFEKIVANYSKKIIWIVDESKMVEDLGAFPLPVEVIPYGSQQLMNLFKDKGYAPVLRENEEGKPYLTDMGNYIIDLHLKKIEDPHALANSLIQQTGVVEHGLFLDCVNTVLIGSEKGVNIRHVRK